MRDDTKSNYLKGILKLMSVRSMPELLRFIYLHNDPDDAKNTLPVSNSYYVFQQDVLAIKELLRSGVICASNTETVIDFGPGDTECFRQKVFPLITAANAQRYIAVDFSAHILARIGALAEDLIPTLQVEKIEIDFFKVPVQIPRATRSLSLILGNTLGGLPIYQRGKFPTESFVGFLRSIRNRLCSESRLLVSTDTNDNPTNVVAAYTTSLTTSFFSRALNWIAEQGPEFRILAAGLEPHVRFDLGANCIVFELLSHTECAVVIGKQLYQLHKGDEFVVGVSYRFPPDVLQVMFAEAGFQQISVVKAAAASMLCTLVRPE